MDSFNVLRFFTMGVPTFGYLRVIAYLQLTAAFRSLSRPSSAPNAKAFSICSSSLELLLYIDLNILLGSLYAWIAVFFILAVKRHFLSCLLWQNCFFYPITEKPDFVIHDFLFFPFTLSVMYYFSLIRFSMNICCIALASLLLWFRNTGGLKWTRTTDLALIRRAL